MVTIFHINRKYLFWLASLGVLAVFSYALMRQEASRLDELLLSGISGLKADISLEGVDYYHHVGERRDWRLKADEAHFFEKAQELGLVKIRMEMSPDAGGPLEITSERGLYDMKNKLVVLEGNVVITTSDGRRLETARLFYDESRKLVWNKVPVVISGGGLKVRGSCLNYDLKSGRMSIKEQSTLIEGGQELFE